MPYEHQRHCDGCLHRPAATGFRTTYRHARNRWPSSSIRRDQKRCLNRWPSRWWRWLNQRACPPCRRPHPETEVRLGCLRRLRGGGCPSSSWRARTSQTRAKAGEPLLQRDPIGVVQNDAAAAVSLRDDVMEALSSSSRRRRAIRGIVTVVRKDYKWTRSDMSSGRCLAKARQKDWKSPLRT